MQVTLVAVGIAHGLHGLAVMLHIMAPSLYNPSAGKREVASIALLNSVTLAVACRLAAADCHMCMSSLSRYSGYRLVWPPFTLLRLPLQHIFQLLRQHSGGQAGQRRPASCHLQPVAAAGQLAPPPRLRVLDAAWWALLSSNRLL